MTRFSERLYWRVSLVIALGTALLSTALVDGVAQALSKVLVLVGIAGLGAAAALEFAGYFEWRARNAGKPTKSPEPPVGHADDVARLYPAPWHCRNAGADLERVSGATVIEDADGRVVLLLPHYRTEPSIERAQRLGEWIARATNKQAAHE